MLNFEKTFRQACEQRAKTLPSNVPLIKNIAAVGAFDGQFGGEKRDSLALTTMMRYFDESGIAFDPDFEIDVVNFQDNRDFFVEDSPIDLLFVAFIMRERVMRVTQSFNVSTQNVCASEDNINKLSVTFSPQHSESGWNVEAHKRGAKIILTHGGNFEINTRCFEHFSTLVESPVRHGAGEEETLSLYEQFGQEVDYPMGWFGVSADMDYMSSIAAHVGKTDLARAIQYKVKQDADIRAVLGKRTNVPRRF